MAGSIFENYIISEILKKEIHAKTNAELFYLRTSSMLEIDLIIDRKQYKEMIEIKNIMDKYFGILPELEENCQDNSMMPQIGPLN